MAKGLTSGLPIQGGKTNRALVINSAIPVALIAIIGILLFPMPTWFLDIGVAGNITISMVVLFVALYLDRPLSFSSFPAILLMTTLFRLAMNVAATRLILMNGQNGMDAAGHVIQAFGEFVISGNYIIGVVMFIAISMVNLKVVTKGSGRIAEVAARFTLDALPGKQMAIDSDLNAGMINETEAKRRRKELSMEAEFYGAMDGAAKFVSGDATAGVFITGINIVGGLFIGIVQHGMPWMEALQVYTLLTIGDGLVAQIASLIISVAAGMIVARAASGDDLGTEVFGQLGSASQPLFITSGVCLVFSLIPGMPFLPFLILSGSVGTLAFLRQSAKSGEDKQALATSNDEKKAELPGPKPGSKEEVTALLGLDLLELEVGFELVSLVDGGDLVDRIRSLRRQFAIDYGFIVPPIHIRDNVRIKGSEYRLLLKGTPIGIGELRSHHLLAMDPGNIVSPIQGIPTKEPAFGLDALWIPITEKERAQFAGYTVVDLSTVATTHITELIRTHMCELLGRQEVQHLMDTLAKDHPKVVEELVPGLLTLGQVQQVLVNLLREQISIRDFRTVIETIADWAPHVKHPEKLAEFVRRKLSRTITNKYLNPKGILPLASFNTNVEKLLGEAVQQTDEGTFLALEPTIAQQLVTKLNRAGEKFMEMGQTPLLLAPGHLRAALAHFVERFAPGYAVISHQEIAPNTKVQSLGVIGLEG
jgi:flagellar biosynthesis protein FlhA